MSGVSGFIAYQGKVRLWKMGWGGSRVSTGCQREGVQLPCHFADEISWVVPCKQAMCHGLADVVPMVAKVSFK